MRSFDDEQGDHWQAAVMEASFGNVLMIFTRIGADDVMQKPLDSANLQEAERVLAKLDEPALRGYLAEALPWR